MSNSIPVVLVPGIVNPVGLSYGPLIEDVGGSRGLILKELEVYLHGEVPPAGYDVFMEADGIIKTADDAGVDTFHLVGYSAGGIAALAAIDRYPERLRSVTLIEPFGTGHYGISPEETAFLDHTASVLALPLEERVAAFLPLNLDDGVEPPIQLSGQTAHWMELRPMGIEGLIKSAMAARFDAEPFRAFRKPVYFAMGSLSNRAWYAMARTLENLFTDIKVDVYEGLHHLTPPQRSQPERFAEALRKVWSEGDAL